MFLNDVNGRGEGAGVALSGNASDNSILKITLTFTMAVQDPRVLDTRSNACRRRHAVSIDDELIPQGKGSLRPLRPCFGIPASFLKFFLLSSARCYVFTLYIDIYIYV